MHNFDNEKVTPLFDQDSMILDTFIKANIMLGKTSEKN